MPRVKRRRLEPEENVQAEPPNGIEHWMKLPVEMLTEVISYLASPDILALARTNVFFFNILVKNDHFQYIWKEARQRFIPAPIPAPSLHFTEVSLIAFLFGPSPCSECGKMTQNLHFSYSLLVRACSPHCERIWKSKNIMFVLNELPPANLASARAVQSWLPYLEYPASTGFCYIRDVWTAEIAKYERSLDDPAMYTELQQKYAQQAARLPAIMEYSDQLCGWGGFLQVWLQSCRRKNQRILGGLCKSQTWDETIFRDTPLYSKLLSWKMTTREVLTPQEIKHYEPEFKSQVVALSNKRINAAVSETIRLNQIGLRRYWNKLKSTDGDTPLLSYPEFRKLGMAKILEQTNTNKSGTLEFARRMSRAKQHKEAVLKELKTNEATRSHLQREMQAVLDMKRLQLAEKLGYSREECNAISGDYVHPVERITSWFSCKRCVGCSYPMAFAEVAEHRCRGLTRKENKKPWNADWFHPHQQAINAGKEILRVLSKSEATFSCDQFYDTGPAFLCKSCTVPIVLGSDDLLFIHCQRHDSIKLESISIEEARKYMCLDLDEVQVILSNIARPTKYGQKLRQQKIYGCRHCESGKHLPLFTFNGIRSHLKAKHNITSIYIFEDIKHTPLTTTAILREADAVNDTTTVSLSTPAVQIS